MVGRDVETMTCAPVVFCKIKYKAVITGINSVNLSYCGIADSVFCLCGFCLPSPCFCQKSLRGHLPPLQLVEALSVHPSAVFLFVVAVSVFPVTVVGALAMVAGSLMTAAGKRLMPAAVEPVSAAVRPDAPVNVFFLIFFTW